MLQAGNLPWHAGSPGPLRGSKATTYEGGVRVPCLIHWPQKFTRRGASPEIASSIDLFATIVAAAGANEAVAEREIDGVSLLPYLTGETESWPRDEFFYFHGYQLHGVRQGPWKLRLKDGVELFHLDRDPSERYNVAEDEPDRVALLKAMAEAKVEQTGANRGW